MHLRDGADEQILAGAMIEVHGTNAAGVARDNARTAALAGQSALAKSWIRVLGAIQRCQINKTASSEGAGMTRASAIATQG
jgi:hypothetical protein